MKKTIFSFMISSYFILTATLTAHTQDGSLDLTFGTGGKVTTAFDVQGEGHSVAVRSDGKIVVAGIAYDGSGSGSGFALFCYNSDGTLDTTFDVDGKVTTAIGSAYDEGNSVAIQSDDKIVVAGESGNGNDYDFALVRYNINGTLDSTFSSDGKVTTDFDGFDDYASSVAIQDDGKIVVAGYSNNGSNDDFAVVRYNSDGSLDNTFSSDGKAITSIGSSDDIGFSTAIQGDDKIVVAGSSYNGSVSDFAVVRYNSDGTLDNTFDFDGKVTTDFEGDDVGGLVAVQDNGRIVVAGGSNNGTDYDFAVVRYNSDGTLDNTFDSDGKVTTDFDVNLDIGTSVAIQSDGRIVVAGIAAVDSFGYDFALARYNSNGILDNTFGSGGKVTTDFGDVIDIGWSVAIQSDGKIVMAGYSGSGGAAVSVARYNVSTVGITEGNAKENTLTFSPNPFSNELVIRETKENDEIIFFDVMGNEVMWQKTFDAETKINTEKLLPGFYFLMCADGVYSTTNKIVKF